MGDLQRLVRLCLMMVAAMFAISACQMQSAPATEGMATGTTVMLSGQEEVPPVSASGAGTAQIAVAPDRTVRGRVTISGVNATAAHIHQGAKGANGPVILPLIKVSDSAFAVPDNAKLTEEQYAQYQAGKLYVNVHSSRYPAGEIRGQLQPK